MKQCKKCGLVQDDRRQCIDCGAVLSDSMSKVEEERYREEFSETLERMSTRCDEFYVSPKQRVFGIVAAALTILAVIALVLGANFTPYADEVFIYAWIGMICSATAALHLVFPEAMWKLYSFRFRFHIHGEFYPADSYHIVTKFFSYVSFGIGAMSTTWSIVQFFVQLK